MLRVFASETASHPDEVEVFQVDVGGILTVKINEIYELPSQLAEVPHQVGTCLFYFNDSFLFANSDAIGFILI